MLNYLILLFGVTIALSAILVIRALVKGPTYLTVAIRFFRRSGKFTRRGGIETLLFELTLPALFITTATLVFSVVLWAEAGTFTPDAKDAIGLKGLLAIAGLSGVGFAGGFMMVLRSLSRAYIRKLVVEGEDIDDLVRDQLFGS